MIITSWEIIKERIPTLFNAPAEFENLEDMKVVFGHQNFTSYRGGTWNSYNSLWASDSKDNYGKCVELNSDSKEGRYCAYVIDSSFDFNDDYVDGYIQLEIIGLDNKSDASGLKPKLWYAYNDSQGSRADVYNYFNDGESIFTSVSSDIQAFRLDFNHSFLDGIYIDSNMPIFDTEAHARAYINNGSQEGCLNLDEDVVETYPTEYYFDEIIYRYDKAYKNKTAIERIKNYYICDKGKIRMVGYLTDSIPHNIVFKASTTDESVNRISCSHNKNVEDIKPTIAVFNIMQSEYNRCGLKGQVTDNNFIYYASPHTNIPIVKKQSDADDYLNHEKTLDEIEQVDFTPDSFYDNVPHTGEDTGEQDTQVTDNTFSEPFLSNQYIMNYNQMESVANLLFSTDPTTLSDIIDKLKMYGENPIADVVDVVHMPFNIDSFISTETSNLKFGSYVSSISGKRITTHGKLKDLGSTRISPLFNDFRDYTNIDISLYLPFCGIVPIDIQMFMNSTISIKCTLDSRSHNLRYYVFCSNGNGTNLVQFHDCSVGKSIIMMGNDTASKMKSNIQLQASQNREMVSSTISAGGNVLSSIASLNPFSMVNGAINLVSDVAQMGATSTYNKIEMNLATKQTQAMKTFSGSQSSGCAENDILYPYLIFKIQNSVLPERLRETYGTPTNLVTKIGNVSGFTMIDNIKLESDATESELSEIYALATSGIIV